MTTPIEKHKDLSARLIGNLIGTERYDERGMKVPSWWRGSVTLAAVGALEGGEL